MDLGIGWAVHFHLQVVHALMLEERKFVAIAIVVEKSSLAADGHIMVIVHQASDTEDGHFDLHDIPTDVELHPINASFGAHFSQSSHDASTCRLGILPNLCSLEGLDEMLRELDFSVDSMAESAGVDHNQSLICLKMNAVELAHGLGHASLVGGQRSHEPRELVDICVGLEHDH